MTGTLEVGKITYRDGGSYQLNLVRNELDSEGKIIAQYPVIGVDFNARDGSFKTIVADNLEETMDLGKPISGNKTTYRGYSSPSLAKDMAALIEPLKGKAFTSDDISKFASIGKAAKGFLVDGDFDYVDQGLVFKSLVGSEFKDGNYKMPEPLAKAALQAAVDTKKYNKIPELDGVTGTSDQEMAAYTLAVSMGKAKVEGNKVTSTFDNTLSLSDSMNAVRNDKETIEIARQILTDTYGVKIQNVDTSDKNFVSNIAAGAKQQARGGRE